MVASLARGSDFSSATKAPLMNMVEVNLEKKTDTAMQEVWSLSLGCAISNVIVDQVVDNIDKYKDKTCLLKLIEAERRIYSSVN